MTFTTCAIISIASFVIYKLIRFGMRGGSITQPAINSTHLYFQIRKVYDKMEPACAAYFALQINSSCARKEFSKRLLLMMVKDFKTDEDWKSLCSMYTAMWLERVARNNVSSRQMVELGISDMIYKSIESAKQDIIRGGTQHEKWLRGLSQTSVLEVVLEYAREYEPPSSAAPFLARDLQPVTIRNYSSASIAARALTSSCV